MAKTKTVYSCTECGAQFPKWTGQCQDCGDWNTLQEELAPTRPVATAANPKVARFEGFAPKADVQKLQQVSVKGTPRFGTDLTLIQNYIEHVEISLASVSACNPERAVKLAIDKIFFSEIINRFSHAVRRKGKELLATYEFPLPDLL